MSTSKHYVFYLLKYFPNIIFLLFTAIICWLYHDWGTMRVYSIFQFTWDTTLHRQQFQKSSIHRFDWLVPIYQISIARLWHNWHNDIIAIRIKTKSWNPFTDRLLIEKRTWTEKHCKLQLRSWSSIGKGQRFKASLVLKKEKY